MASRSFEHVVRDVPGLRAVDSAAGVITRRRLRYRLAVAAPSAAEVVRLAGGWLFDHVIAGWDVVVLTAEPGDDRALRILGATAMDLDTALDTPRRGARVDVVAAAMSLYDADERVRTRLRAAVDRGVVADARLWDTRRAAHAADIGGMEAYRPTAAARAFKAQALAATAAPVEDTGATELFQSVTPARAFTTV
ncbi:hypothetical protein LO772_03720 [Yinghuangia sp. ASG 101]|uniref:hypothetical protein n=1 Tax=Yinghuangia sp. ASG 101 TaxID=2896848 RepID=UPI001E464EAA|nr:hypothetical protein [Yinghuangia sp. ASG 101]UGQ12741.1 hypothetical protein LO772_03720 [Yinghuangia sp. ASG 101]